MPCSTLGWSSTWRAVRRSGSVAFKPNEPTRVKLELQDVLHTFQPGHRIMFQVQSTWFPLIDRNPQKYVDNIYLADDKDFIKATQRVYRAKQHPSCVHLLVLPTE